VAVREDGDRRLARITDAGRSALRRDCA